MVRLCAYDEQNRNSILSQHNFSIHCTTISISFDSSEKIFKFLQKIGLNLLEKKNRSWKAINDVIAPIQPSKCKLFFPGSCDNKFIVLRLCQHENTLDIDCAKIVWHLLLRSVVVVGCVLSIHFSISDLWQYGKHLQNNGPISIIIA